jgi:hypothetical protein
MKFLLLLFGSACLRMTSQVNTAPWVVGASTINDLKKYAANLQLPVRESRDSKDILTAQARNSQKTSAILEVFVDTTDNGNKWLFSHWGYGTLCSGVRTFWMDASTTGDIQMGSMYLYFLRDTLYKISFNDPGKNLIETWRSRNPGWKMNYKNVYAYCGRQKEGDTLYAHQEITLWTRPGTQIRAEFILEDGYDIETCKKRIDARFDIVNVPVDKYVYKCDRAVNSAWTAGRK